MNYHDTLARLEGQISQLEDARMHEAQERDRLRSEVNRLRAALRKLVFAARTSGGVAGRDELLCSACDEAERLLTRS